MVATLTLPIFLVLYGNIHLHMREVPSAMEQASSNISFKLKEIQQNRNACSGEAPFALSIETNSDRTQLGFIISLTNRQGSGKEYLSVDDDSGVATFGDHSSASLFVPEFEHLGTQERDGIESCKGFFLITNSTGQPRTLHITDIQNPHFAVYANTDRPLPGSVIVLGLRRICPTVSD